MFSNINGVPKFGLPKITVLVKSSSKPAFSAFVE